MNDQHGISRENLLRIFPPYLATDERQRRLAQLTAEALERQAQDVELVGIYRHIDTLPEWALDRMAKDFKVDWYDPEYTLEEKRATLKSAWRVHRMLGTKAAVEEAMSAIYPKTRVEEWFRYGGEPYHFKLLVDVTCEKVDPEKHRRVLERVKYYKPLRSVMDGVSYEARPSGRATVYMGTRTGGVNMKIGTRIDLDVLRPKSAMAELAWEGDEEQISTICKSKLTKYISSRKKPALTDDKNDVEMETYISDQYVQLVGDPGKHKGLIELTDLWVKQDEYGKRNATISINGVTVSYKGKTEDEDHSGGITVPITFDYGTNNIITGMEGLLYVTVSPEDTSAPSTNYVILVRRRRTVSEIESVGFTSEQRTAELQHTASGEVETLGLAEAQEKYDSLPFSAPMSDMEKAFYYDNGDPATGKPIRRIVYRGWLTSTDLKANKLWVGLTGKNSKSVAYLMTNVSATDKVAGYAPTKYWARYEDYISADERSFIKPLEDALAEEKSTGQRQETFIRVYGEVRSEAVEGGLDGSVSYMVLELGISARGNYKIARVKTDEGGSVLRDSEGEAQLVPAGTLTKKDDVYAVWVCETGQDHKTAQPNVEVVSWTFIPNNTADVDYEGEGYPGSDPITNPTGNYFEEVGVPGRAGGVSPESRDPFVAKISGDATEITVTVRTEDPTSLVGIGYAVTEAQKDALYIRDYKAGGMSKTFSIDPDALGVVYIHVKSQNLANQAYNYMGKNHLLYGRRYELDLERRENT